MKSLVLAAATLVLGTPLYAQYSATSLTRKIVPQQQPAQPARPAPAYAVPAQSAPPREQTPQEAKKAQLQQNKNDVKQFEFYKRRAAEGSDDAQYQLAMRYMAGRGTDKNQELAREWFEKAAKQGHSEASKKLLELGPAPAPSKAAAASSAASATTAAAKN
jgi:TPR repeat protein